MNPKFKIYMLSALLLIGLAVETTNLQSLFYGFMQVFRPDWYNFFNHLAALGLAAFWLLGIVYNGFFGNQITSWCLAVLTMCVSLYVYKEIASFSIENFDFSHRHAVVLLQSVVLPYFVAFYTHQIAELIRNKPSKVDEVLDYVNEVHTVVNALNTIKQPVTQQLGTRSISADKNSITIRKVNNPSPQPTITPVISEDFKPSEDTEKKS